MSLNDTKAVATGVALASDGVMGIIAKTRVVDIIGNRTEIYCIGPNETVEAAAQKLRSWRVRTACICDDSGNVVGILGQSDISSRVVADGLDPRAASVRDVMTSNPQSVDIETDIMTVVQTMRSHGISHVVITRTTAEGEQFFGMVSANDILGVLAQHAGPNSEWMQQLAGHGRH